MNQWINLDAIWKIVVFGLLTGAGLPVLFALGLLALESPGAGGRPSPGRWATAGLCFAVVLAVIGWGIALIVQG